MRKLIALLAGLIFTVHLTSCTSSDSKDESLDDGAVAESTSGTDGDLESMDAPLDDSSMATADSGASEGFLDEQLPEDALGESDKTASAEPPQAEAPPADAPKDEVAAAGAPDALELGDTGTPPPPLEETPPPTDALADTGTPPPPLETEPAPPVDTNSTAAVDTATDNSFGTSDTDSSAAGTVASSEPAPEAPVEHKAKVSLKKIESAPFNRQGILLNAVYVARPNDSYGKISKKIYGDTKKAKDLKKANPYVKTIHPGDKIYYNSPIRPNDDTKLLTFYEDSGMVPEVYVAQEGDDLKKVSKKLLGYSSAWKEIWATNGIDSKGALPAGTELRYWKSAPSAPAPVAPVATMENTPPPEMAMNTPPPDQMAQPMPDLPPPPPPTEMAPPPTTPPPVAQNELPPPPPPAEMAPPPPPPPVEMPPPPPAEAVNPPPPPPMPKKAPGNMAGPEGLDNDMVMTLAGAGIILAGLAAVILIRRRRQNRDMASAFNDTQVGT